MKRIDHLFIASMGCFLAALLHIVIIFGGADWFRFFGAGEEMATQVEAGSHNPTIAALSIALLLITFGLYGLSVGKRIRVLPLKNIVVGFVAALFIFRALAGFIVLFIPLSPHHQELAERPLFSIITSLAIGYIGMSYLFGLLKVRKKTSFPSIQT